MRDDVIAAVQARTGCSVEAFLSDDLHDPDVAVEIFLIARSDSDGGHRDEDRVRNADACAVHPAHAQARLRASRESIGVVCPRAGDNVGQNPLRDRFGPYPPPPSPSKRPAEPGAAR